MVCADALLVLQCCGDCDHDGMCSYEHMPQYLQPLASSAPRQNALTIMSPEMTAGFAADVRICAWMLDAIHDVDLLPHLVNHDANSDETKISHSYVEKMFERCDLYLAHTQKESDNDSKSLSKLLASLPIPRQVQGCQFPFRKQENEF